MPHHTQRALNKKRLAVNWKMSYMYAVWVFSYIHKLGVIFWYVCEGKKITRKKVSKKILLSYSGAGILTSFPFTELQ